MTETVSAPLFFQLSVEALEDLHAGSGTGGGDIDALLQRDRLGRPVIRASHLKGLLREAGEALVDLKQTTTELLTALLGKEGTDRGAVRLTSLSAQEPWVTRIWGSTQRVEGGRAPKPDSLRFIEHVAAGTRFEATLRLADAELAPLLEQILNRIDRLGGERNRGSGLVKLAWQRQRATDTTQPPKPGTGRCLRLVLRNLEPLCLPATGHPGNLIRSYSRIRGQTLRGALMAWAIHSGRKDQLSLLERIKVGDALPLPTRCREAELVLPLPLSILTDKPSGGDPTLPWWAGAATATAFDDLGETPEADEKRKRPGAHEYLCRSSGIAHWQRYSPPMQVRLRNATPKRGSTRDPDLFSLEEIAEDTCFQAELRCDDDDTAQAFLTAFAPLLAGADWLLIGRAGQPTRVESVSAMPQPTMHHDLADDWTLTLVSDAIVRGEGLGFLDNLSMDLLCQWTGLSGGEDWKILADVVETEPVHGFNAVTGLPRTPALALRRGSCWRIQGTGSARLAKALLQKATLGERVDEGFGRFLIGLQPIATNALGKPPKEHAALSERRHEALLEQARRLADQIGGSGGPSPSQLQWLRSRASAVETDAQLRETLREIEQAPTRRPMGGEAWTHFPHPELRQALDRLDDFTEKRHLIAYLVQWRMLAIKANPREDRR